MKPGEVYYKFTVENEKPILKTFSVKGFHETKPNTYIYEEDYPVTGDLFFLRKRDKNHVYFETEIGAASSIYEQYKLRNQQGVSSPLITKIVQWDYFKKLLEEYPGIMV